VVRFLLFSVSPRLRGRFVSKQKRQPRFELPFPDEGAPSERLGENYLLHVHVFRQAIEPAFGVPRLDHQDVSAFASGDRLVKGRAG
jgi:hypothetical protein